MMATTEHEPMLMRFALPKACAANARKMGIQTCRARPFIFQDLVFCMGLGDMHTYSHAENQGGAMVKRFPFQKHAQRMHGKWGFRHVARAPLAFRAWFSA